MGVVCFSFVPFCVRFIDQGVEVILFNVSKSSLLSILASKKILLMFLYFFLRLLFLNLGKAFYSSRHCSCFSLRATKLLCPIDRNVIDKARVSHKFLISIDFVCDLRTNEIMFDLIKII